MSSILVTGAAGFIGAYACRALLAQGQQALGIDNFNAYYDPKLKRDRVAALCPTLASREIDIADRQALFDAIEQFRPQAVLHLAAQAGVRYSLENPQAYLHSNLAGFLNILEACRTFSVPKLVFASSSSIYGHGNATPFAENQPTQRPLSFYAATKQANESMAYAYAHLYGIACTALRFFTVYGPWGRPDMAPILFSRALLEDKPIALFNQGDMRRDFTYIDDIIAGVLAALRHEPMDRGTAFQAFNLGNNKPVALSEFVATLEAKLGKKAALRLEKMQPGDMVETAADIGLAQRELGFSPKTSLDQGLGKLAQWCKEYYA